MTPQPVQTHWHRYVPSTFNYYPVDGLRSSGSLISPPIRTGLASTVFPKLRNDSFFSRSRDGVLFRTDSQWILLSGDTLHPLFSALAPALNGEHSLDDLCEGLDPQRREVFLRIVKLLLEAGFLTDLARSDRGRLTAEELMRFARQIEFVDHLATDSVERFARFRSSRIILAGNGDSFEACAIELLRNGCGRLSLMAIGEGRPLKGLHAEIAALKKDGVVSELQYAGDSAGGARMPEMKEFDGVVYCSDNLDVVVLQMLSRACLQVQRPMIWGISVGPQSIMGPLILPPNSCCWLCGVLRIVEDFDTRCSLPIACALFRGQKYRTVPTLARRVGADVALETFKLIVGPLRLQTENYCLIQNVKSSGSLSAELIPHAVGGCLDFCAPILSKHSR